MSKTASKPMAALWMAGWLSLTLVMAVAGREALRELNVFELMEVRSLIGFLLLSPMIYRAGGFAALKTSRLKHHVARNLIHYVSQLGWFFALTLIPIGQVVAIEFTMPIWTAILAASFLGERITSWKGVAILIGICGTFSHYCLASAMRYADATVVVPMDFLRVPLTATAGWLLYAERLDVFTGLGAALILAGNLLNLKAPQPVPVQPAPETPPAKL
jgi:drug/metabolite transporter (DMT)-like permease